MFYYYGRKKRLAPKYPIPRQGSGVIIEPFAGSAAYSLHGDNWRNEVILIEKEPRIAALWRWLISEATEDDILAKPPVEVGEYTSDLLVILHSASAVALSYKNLKVTEITETNWNTNRITIAKDLHKVKHWAITEGDYSKAPDVLGTWFIDPPYAPQQHRESGGNKVPLGRGYSIGADIDYQELGEWSKERRGSVIVCEQEGAEWLDFRPLSDHRTATGRTTREVIWTNGLDNHFPY